MAHFVESSTCRNCGERIQREVDAGESDTYFEQPAGTRWLHVDRTGRRFRPDHCRPTRAEPEGASR